MRSKRSGPKPGSYVLQIFKVINRAALGNYERSQAIFATFQNSVYKVLSRSRPHFVYSAPFPNQNIK